MLEYARIRYFKLALQIVGGSSKLINLKLEYFINRLARISE